MKKKVILFMLLGLLLSGCGTKRSSIENRISLNAIPDCYELNRNIFGEHAGRICKSGDLIAYSKYTYMHQNYSEDKTDGLYVRDESSGKTRKIADGIICGIVIRKDGIYYLKRSEKGEVFLYNYDLYRYTFHSRKNELIVKDCSFVQYSEDAVFYCRQYLSNKELYIEYNMPLDLENEGKIVRHSLVTGEEKTVAETEGSIFNFLVTKNSIFYTAGEGNAFDGGRNLFMCNHDGEQKRKLTDCSDGCIKLLNADEESQEILFYTRYSAIGGEKKNSGYSLMDYQTSAMVWEFFAKDLPDGVFGEPTFYRNDLFFRSVDDIGASNELLCISIGQERVSRCWTQDICTGLYVFNDKLYAVNLSDQLICVNTGDGTVCSDKTPQ